MAGAATVPIASNLRAAPTEAIGESLRWRRGSVRWAFFLA
jgi:hypothetical protein